MQMLYLLLLCFPSTQALHAASPISVQAPTSAKASEDKVNYIVGDTKSNTCPEGSIKIGTEVECKVAAATLGKGWNGPDETWQGARDDRPGGCWFGNLGHSNWNPSAGSAFQTSTPICKQALFAPGPGTASSNEDKAEQDDHSYDYEYYVESLAAYKKDVKAEHAIDWTQGVAKTDNAVTRHAKEELAQFGGMTVEMLKCKEALDLRKQQMVPQIDAIKDYNDLTADEKLACPDEHWLLPLEWLEGREDFLATMDQ